MVPKTTFVEIESIVLEVGERAMHIPEDTKHQPFVMRIKGFLLQDARIGDRVEIETVTGRREVGCLKTVKPYFTHSFGNFVDEAMTIRLQILKEAGMSHE